jgi:hypothetical protein
LPASCSTAVGSQADCHIHMKAFARTASPDFAPTLMCAPACRMMPRWPRLVAAQRRCRVLGSPSWMQHGPRSCGCRLLALSPGRCGTESLRQGHGRQSSLLCVCCLQTVGVQAQADPTVLPAAAFARRSCPTSTCTLAPSLPRPTSPKSPSALPSTASCCRVPLLHGTTTCSRPWQGSRHNR